MQFDAAVVNGDPGIKPPCGHKPDMKSLSGLFVLHDRNVFAFDVRKLCITAQVDNVVGLVHIVQKIQLIVKESRIRNPFDFDGADGNFRIGHHMGAINLVLLGDLNRERSRRNRLPGIGNADSGTVRKNGDDVVFHIKILQKK